MTARPLVMVTGAAGFIGGRVVEVLHQSGIATVRAGVRQWGSAARLGRLPVDIIRCDITKPAEARLALEGVSVVVHCAVGSRDTTVAGTRTMLEAAAASGVRRFIHLSTVDVYGLAEGEIEESRPLVRTGRAYGDMKVEAEGVCQEFADRVPITILRPTLVHGPFSATWTVDYAQRLRARPWPLPASVTGGTCNLLYVDDLVRAICLAMERDTPSGEAFNVNGPERPSWTEYFQRLGEALGYPPLVERSETSSRVASSLMHPVRVSAKVALKHLQPQIMGLYQRYDLAKRLMKHAERLIKGTPTPDEFSYYARTVSYPTARAEQVLGYRPVFPLARALPPTVAWLRHHGYAGPGATVA